MEDDKALLWKQGGQLRMSFMIFNLENNGEIGLDGGQRGGR